MFSVSQSVTESIRIWTKFAKFTEPLTNVHTRSFRRARIQISMVPNDSFIVFRVKPVKRLYVDLKDCVIRTKNEQKKNCRHFLSWFLNAIDLKKTKRMSSKSNNELKWDQVFLPSQFAGPIKYRLI